MTHEEKAIKLAELQEAQLQLLQSEAELQQVKATHGMIPTELVMQLLERVWDECSERVNDIAEREIEVELDIQEGNFQYEGSYDIDLSGYVEEFNEPFETEAWEDILSCEMDNHLSEKVDITDPFNPPPTSTTNGEELDSTHTV